MSEADKAGREYDRMVIALRVLTDRVQVYVDSQVKALHLDPSIVEVAVHYRVPEDPRG